MQYEYAEPTPRTLQQYCLGGSNGTFKEEGEGEVWKFGPNRSKIRSSSSGVQAVGRAGSNSADVHFITLLLHGKSLSPFWGHGGRGV